MRLTDWLGNEYGPGDTVIYPVGASRSIEMQMAEIVDIWTVYMCPDSYKWKRLEEGAEVPTKTLYKWDRYKEERVVDEIKPVETQLRVRLQPLGKGSRDFHTRTDSKTIWVDPEGNDITYSEAIARLEAEHGPQYNGGKLYDANWTIQDFPEYTARREAVKPKAVTLSQGIDNITRISGFYRGNVDGYKCSGCGSTNPALHTFHAK